MGSHRCQRPMCSGKHLLKGWMPSSVGSMESSRSKTPCAQFCPQPTVPPSPKPALPRQHRPVPQHLPLAPSWPSHWPAPLPLPPCRVPPMPVMPWWWIAPVPPEWCAPASDVARQATWAESAPSQTRAPGVGRPWFRCGQAGHMVREFPLPDARPQSPRPQVRAVESQSRSLEDYENEIALLRDRLELYEKERKAPVEEQDFGDEAQ